MKIIIEIKDSATVQRIEELGNHLNAIEKAPCNTMFSATGFDDVINRLYLEKEW